MNTAQHFAEVKKTPVDAAHSGSFLVAGGNCSITLPHWLHCGKRCRRRSAIPGHRAANSAFADDRANPLRGKSLPGSSPWMGDAWANSNQRDTAMIQLQAVQPPPQSPNLIGGGPTPASQFPQQFNGSGNAECSPNMPSLLGQENNGFLRFSYPSNVSAGTLPTCIRLRATAGRHELAEPAVPVAQYRLRHEVR